MKISGQILVVDDEKAVRKLVHAALSAYGFQDILEAEKGERAVKLSRTHAGPIPVMLSDINLGGGIDGVQLARAITSTRPETKIVLMSGHPQPLDLEPAWSFLSKPFAPSALIAAVEEALERPATQSFEATADLTVFTLDLKKKTIPAGAVLEDFRIGPGHEGLLSRNPNVASFHHGGEVYFNLAHEIAGKTRIVAAGKRFRAA